MNNQAQKYRAYAKVNIFLKIRGKRDNYHTLFSRFIKVNSLYDTLYFQPSDSKEFEIVGNFSCKVQQNTIYKAYKALLEYTSSAKLKTFMIHNAIVVEKKIPAFAGLGGGSSDAATYLKMCNQELNLGLKVEELADIAIRVGADVPFFIYDYQSANVSGIGEVIEKFEEQALELEVFTPQVEISTPAVFKTFREFYYKELSDEERTKLARMSSLEVLKNLNIKNANDLFESALHLHPELKDYVKDGWFFSGTGSSFFKIK
ncbi:MAG: 4-(cytidine 5'-diphospho)-2-C-methyl-D-erythritol kinase [Helicobacteraceae bacterium]|nr:4-(cytidine 5'-diphospho)-2-C-methyl-D-erythritol kinase [Helicobacteraceae bacterium]